ncbi:MAG: N-formylglutamate amidohydrolase [Novosphingobium sp.]|nr:N-formylglutamate amidohydrolase [Novosphingobium sp.]
MPVSPGQQGAMPSSQSGHGDSQGSGIPGLPGVPPFVLFGPEPSAVPILIAVPHAGRAYPPAMLRRMRFPAQSILRLEDRLADEVARAVARETGARLLVAQAPRAMIDLNRAPDDIDWGMIAGNGPPRPGAVGRRARGGLGLIPRRLSGMGEIWKDRHGEEELSAYISRVHEPYHQVLAHELAVIRDRWGASLLIDLHSMPPLVSSAPDGAAEFVVGDRFGTSCDGGIVAATFTQFSACGRRAAHNRPYAGDYVLQRHARPASGVHAFQLEIDRRCYLDSRLAELGEGLAELVENLAALVRRLTAQVSALGRESARGGWAEAAE